MSVVDLLDESDQLMAHEYKFYPWPKAWASYNLQDSFSWEIYPFRRNQVTEIPRKPGIYSFVIQPGITSYPDCSYLMYIGKAEGTLRKRFQDYLYEQNNREGRPRILRLLNRYQGYLYFRCSIIEKIERIVEIERALLKAFIPPCNSELPAEIRHVKGAFQ